MGLILTWAIAGIVGLVTYLQATNGGWKLPLVAIGLILLGFLGGEILQVQMAGNGQLSVLVGSVFLVGVLIALGSVFGFARHWVSARTLAWTSGGLTLGAARLFV